MSNDMSALHCLSHHIMQAFCAGKVVRASAAVVYVNAVPPAQVAGDTGYYGTDCQETEVLALGTCSAGVQVRRLEGIRS